MWDSHPPSQCFDSGSSSKSFVGPKMQAHLYQQRFQSSNAISVSVRLAMSTKTPYYARLFNKLGEDLKSC